MIDHVEALMKNAVARLQGMNGFRGTQAVTVNAVVEVREGVYHRNPDTGAGEEAGIFTIRVPLFLGQDGPDARMTHNGGDLGAATWTEDALAPENWFEFDEIDLLTWKGFGSTGQVVSYITEQVEQIRLEHAASGAASGVEGEIEESPELTEEVESGDQKPQETTDDTE